MSVAAPPETALIVTIEQILDDGALCHCGAEAVLVVTTEPDGDPGPTCYEHAAEWIGMCTSLVDRLFGPKEE